MSPFIKALSESVLRQFEEGAPHLSALQITESYYGKQFEFLPVNAVDSIADCVKSVIYLLGESDPSRSYHPVIQDWFWHNGDEITNETDAIKYLPLGQGKKTYGIRVAKGINDVLLNTWNKRCALPGAGGVNKSIKKITKANGLHHISDTQVKDTADEVRRLSIPDSLKPIEDRAKKLLTSAI